MTGLIILYIILLLTVFLIVYNYYCCSSSCRIPVVNASWRKSPSDNFDGAGFSYNFTSTNDLKYIAGIKYDIDSADYSQNSALGQVISISPKRIRKMVNYNLAISNNSFSPSNLVTPGEYLLDVIINQNQTQIQHTTATFTTRITDVYISGSFETFIEYGDTFYASLKPITTDSNNGSIINVHSVILSFKSI